MVPSLSPRARWDCSGPPNPIPESATESRPPSTSFLGPVPPACCRLPRLGSRDLDGLFGDSPFLLRGLGFLAPGLHGNPLVEHADDDLGVVIDLGGGGGLEGELVDEDRGVEF